MAFDDDVPVQPLPVSPAMAAQLEALGLWEMQGWLCGPMSLRSLKSVGALFEEDFGQLCNWARIAGFSLGSVAALRILREEVLGLKMVVAVQAAATVNATLPTLPSVVVARSNDAIDFLHAAAQALGQLRNLPEESAICVLPEALFHDLESAKHRHHSAHAVSPESAMSEFAQALTIIDSIFIAAKHDVYGCLIGDVKAARLATQDALVYCCRDGVDPKGLQDKNTEVRFLRESFQSAFGRDISSEDLCARLMNTNWQLFKRDTDKEASSKKKRRKTKTQSPRSGGVDGGMQQDQRQDSTRLVEAAPGISIGEKVYVESAASEQRHVIAMKYTVKNSFIDDRASEVSAVSYAATWCTRLSRATCPTGVVQEGLDRHEATSALPPRKQIDELLEKEMTQDGESPDFGGESGKRVLSALMEELPDMRAVSIWKKWIDVLRVRDHSDTQRLGFGLNNAREFIEKLGNIAIRFSPEDESAVLLCIRALGALAAATDAAESAFLVLVQLLGVAHSVDVQTAALSELFEGLKPALLLEFWEIEEANMDAEQWQARRLLESLGQTAWSASLESLDTIRVRLLAWARAGANERYGQRRMLQMRLKLIAILFGASVFVMLLQNDNSGFWQFDFCHSDENFVYAALRVFTELKVLNLLGGAESKQVVAAVIDPCFKPEGRLCHSACAGVLGELCAGVVGELQKGKVANLDADADEVDRIIRQIVMSANYWWSTNMLRSHLRDFMFESLWALKQIFQGVDLSTTQWADQCLLLVQEILNDQHYNYCRREWPDCDEDKLMILASQLQRPIDAP